MLNRCIPKFKKLKKDRLLYTKICFRNVFLQKEFDDRKVFFKKNLTTFQNFGLRPYKPSVAVAVGKKPSASAVEIRPSVDHCYILGSYEIGKVQEYTPESYRRTAADIHREPAPAHCVSQTSPEILTRGKNEKKRANESKGNFEYL